MGAHNSETWHRGLILASHGRAARATAIFIRSGEPQDHENSVVNKALEFLLSLASTTRLATLLNHNGTHSNKIPGILVGLFGTNRYILGGSIKRLSKRLSEPGTRCSDKLRLRLMAQSKEKAI